jgi:hypothetical protein
VISPEESRKIMEISDVILELAEAYHTGDGMPRGDYQGAIEAQIMNAIRFGKEQAKEKS